LFYRSPRAGLRRNAPLPAVLVMAQLRRKGHVLTHRDMKGSELLALGKAAARIHETQFATLSLRQVIRDDAFVRAVRTELGLKMPPASGLLETAIQLYRAQPTLEPPKNIRAPPKRRGPPSPNPSPQPKRAAKALKDQNAGESAIVAKPKSIAMQSHAGLLSMADAARFALRAFRRETHVTQCGSQKVEVKKAGKGWVEYTSQSDAVRKVSGLNRKALQGLLNGGTSDQFEARLVSNEQPISRPVAYSAFASAIGLRPQKVASADLDKYVSKLVPRVVLPDSDKEAPKSWRDLLEYVVELPEFDQGVLYAQTRRAEDERVWALKRAASLGPASEARSKQRRLAAEADADANAAADAAWIEEAVFDDEGLVVGCTAQEEAVRVRFRESWAQFQDNERVMVEYKGRLFELKAAAWPKRIGWGWDDGDGFSGLSVAPCRAVAGKVGEEVALLERTTPSRAIAMTAAAACGDLNLGHKGVRGACTLIASPRKHPHQSICKRDFDPYQSLRAMGLVRRAVTPATRHDGSILDGFEIEDYDLCVPGQQWTMVDLRDESLRLRPLLLATTPEDRRIAGSTVKVSYRRSENVVTLELCRPNRARGPTERTIGVVAMLEAMGFPIYAWLTRRAIENCVPLEFLAYRDPTKGGKYHIDAARNLLLSALMMKSATMKEAAKIDPLHSAAMLKGN
jgi:hypothetical protein